MFYRESKKLNVKTSLLGFGCMRFPTNKDGSIDEEQTLKMFDIAIKSGINYIDTAYPYHNGLSEPFVGKALKKYDRSSIYLATKLPVWAVDSKEKALEIFNGQLEKLQTDYVDFYLLHALDNTKWEKCLELGLVDLCLDLQKQGKIKYFGFSFHDSYEVFEKIVNYRDWDFCQIQFNYMDTEEQAGLKGLKLCEEKGIPNIIMEPLKGGSLTKYSDDVEKMFKDYDNEASVASWGLRYVGSFDNVLVLLSGMSNIEQLEDNIKTFKEFKALNNEEEQIVESVVQKVRDRVKNGCTGCRYCMPCPKGVNIPKMFRMWNTASMYGIFDVVSWSYNNTKEEEFSTSCIKCGLCETKCPQQLNIREDLQKAHQFLIDMKNNK